MDFQTGMGTEKVLFCDLLHESLLSNGMAEFHLDVLLQSCCFSSHTPYGLSAFSGYLSIVPAGVLRLIASDSFSQMGWMNFVYCHPGGVLQIWCYRFCPGFDVI